MSSLLHRLLRWSLGEVDARVLLSELGEAHHRRVESEGIEAANRWRCREVLRAVFLGPVARLGTGLGPGRPKRHSARSESSMLEGLVNISTDVRLGIRALRRRPLFTTVAVGTLGLGIGASTIVFSLVDGVLLEDMPYERPGELVNIWKTWPQWRGQELLDEAWDKIGLTWTEYLSFRDRTQVFSEFGVHRARRMVLTGAGATERLLVGEASPGLLPMLGIRPLLGRLFLPGEEGPGTARLAVLSFDMWRSRFGSDLDIVGRTIELDQQPFEVIGVLRPGLRVHSSILSLLESEMDAGERALWVPIRFDRIDGSQDHEAVGRLAEGVTPEQVRAELDALLRGDRPADRLGFRLTPPKEEIVGSYRASLRLLLAAAGGLLLIACANIAPLVLSETLGRRHEMATRVALGAGRFRIARQVLTESVLLGLLGSALGIALATVGIPSLLSLAPPLPRLEEVGLSHGVLLFAIITGVGTGCLFGLGPAMVLHEDSLCCVRGMAGRPHTGGHGRLRRTLIAAELALTMVLLVTGGLLARSFLSLRRVDPGFDGSSVATVYAHLPPATPHDPEARYELYRRLLERIRAIPGVAQAGGIDKLPFPGKLSGSRIRIEGRAPEETVNITTRDHVILPGYLETMGIPLLAGRTLTESDARAGTPAILINEQMARQYWTDGSPLGARIRIDDDVYDVVGIVANVRERHLSESPKDMVYRVGPVPSSAMSIVANTRGRPEDLIDAMRQAIWAENPDIALSQESTMAALIESSTGVERYRTMLVSVFGILAALLAAVGVFGVTAHSVSKRTREMGIRLALGAQSGSLIRRVVIETTLPNLVGIAAGLLGALAISRLLSGFLFGIEAWDAATYAGVIALLGSLSMGAAVLPASRVGKVDPVHVLKEG